jgi:aminomethyltransferase
VDELKYFRMMKNKINGVEVTISRTGYTGDLGYEIWMDAKDALPIWDKLMEVGGDYGIAPVGILAMDMARVEAGLFMLDVDYTSTTHAWIEPQKSSPYELGLDWTVALDKPGYFVGRRALEREKREGSTWKMVGLEVDWVGMEKHLQASRLAATNPWHGCARKSACDGGQRAGWICIHVHMVTVAEKIHRPCTFAEAIL